MKDIRKFESIVNEYSQRLYRYCCHHLGSDHQLVEETVNDILMLMYKKWDTLDVHGNIGAYLYRIADFCILQTRRKHRCFYSGTQSYEETISELEETLIHFDDYFSGNDTEVEEYLERIFNALPMEYRDIFRLRYIEKKTLNTISALTGIPYSSLRYRLMKVEILVEKEIKNFFK